MYARACDLRTRPRKATGGGNGDDDARSFQHARIILNVPALCERYFPLLSLALSVVSHSLAAGSSLMNPLKTKKKNPSFLRRRKRLCVCGGGGGGGIVVRAACTAAEATYSYYHYRYYIVRVYTSNARAERTVSARNMINRLRVRACVIRLFLFVN